MPAISKKITRARMSKLTGSISNFFRYELNYILGKDSLVPATATQAARLWLRKLNPEKLPPVKGRVLITALRNRTWIEWAFYCAAVARRMGYEATVILDQPLIDKLYPRQFYKENFISIVKKIPGIVLEDISHLASQCTRSEVFRKSAEEWARVAIAYDIHIEEDDVDWNNPRHKALLQFYIERTTILSSGLDVFLQHDKFARCICYSGIIGESKVLLEVLLDHKVETICTEGWGWRPGHMLYNLNSPALDYNTKGWIKAQGEWDDTKEKEIRSFLNFIDHDTQDQEWLSNYYRIQKANVTDDIPARISEFLKDGRPLFLLATNVIGDSSTLRRETIFKGQKAWVAEIVEWFKARPHLKLIVRAHPGELWAGGKCIQYMGSYVEKCAAGAENIAVIHSSEKFNIFSLIPYANCGLAWLSSVGADFVIRGLPAVVAAKPKYSNLGIVEEPLSREEYFSLLEKWAKNKPSTTAAQVLAAKRYIHMVFKGFSFESQGRTYRAMSNTMDGMANQEEHDRFYRILLGIEEPPELISGGV